MSKKKKKTKVRKKPSKKKVVRKKRSKKKVVRKKSSKKKGVRKKRYNQNHQKSFHNKILPKPLELTI